MADLRAPSSPLSAEETQRWTRIGVLAALALLLGYAETFVPIPLPGVKLGLANIAVLAALAAGDVWGAWCISVIKVLAAGLLFGSPLTMAYSAAGTLLAFVGMAPLSRLRSMHVVMVSVVGAVLHEVGQLAVASVLLGTTTVWYATPVMLVAGCATGALCGVLASRLDRSLVQGDTSGGSATSNEPHQNSPLVLSSPSSHDGVLAHGWPLLLLAICVVAVFHLHDLRALAACATASVALCLALGARPQALVGSLRPLAFIAAVTLAAQLFVSPGTALPETARSVLRLLSIAALCLAFMVRVPARDLTANVACMVAPLERVGVRTSGFVLAFDVAVRLIPTMGTIVEPGSFRLRDVAELIPRAYARLEEEATKPNAKGGC